MDIKDLGLKDFKSYLDLDIWLMLISLFSILDIASILVYHKQILNSYEVLKNNYELIAITALLFYSGWKILPPVIRFCFSLLEMGLYEIGLKNDSNKSSYTYRERIDNAKKYALTTKNGLILSIFTEAESKGKKSEYTAQLYVWNYILFIIIFLIYLSIDTKTSELPFYGQVYLYIQNLQLITLNTLLLSLIKWISIIAVGGLIIKTLAEAMAYLQYNDFIFISIGDMDMIEKIIKEETNLVKEKVTNK